MWWIVHQHDVASMIVFLVNDLGVFTSESKGHAPVAADIHQRAGNREAETAHHQV